jgi:hypothetical protein
MAGKNFSDLEWQKIKLELELQLNQEREPFGLPEHREKSVLIGTFNIRELGKVENRSEHAWEFLVMLCQRFDLLAVQEVQDDLSGIRELHHRLGDSYGMVVSDTTGKTPGSPTGSAERLAFLYRRARIEHTELASEISFDRSSVVDKLFRLRSTFDEAWDKHQAKLDAWAAKNEEREAAGKRKLPEPPLVLPMFLTFIRQPHCASFLVLPKDGTSEKPYEFLVVNAHLLYGSNKKERLWEFIALIEWLSLRAKSRKTTYYENLLLLGDCNLEFEHIEATREKIDNWLKGLNEKQLKNLQAAKANFPLLSLHPSRGFLRTNVRQDQTYDQIAIFAHDERLPAPEDNNTAGSTPDQYDYGVIKYTDLFAQALFSDGFHNLSDENKKWIIDRTAWDVSDHMPAWFRLPIPGA